jgi:hypothetical protein
MGKLLNSVTSFLIARVRGQVDSTNYQLTSCNLNNDPTQAPALTYRIAESYFQNNLAGQESDYVLDGGFYTRTIPEADLTLEFGTNDAGVDGKTIISLLVDIH